MALAQCWASGWIGFARSLRAAGFALPAGAVLELARALARLGIERRADVAAAARACLVKRREDWERFGAEFERWFGAGAALRSAAPAVAPAPTAGAAPAGLAGWGGAGEPEPAAAPEPARPRELGARWSAREQLRRVDFACWGAAERAQLERLLGGLVLRVESRPGLRARPLRAGRRGRELDLAGALRERVRRGELGALRWRDRARRPRRLILVCDVSGSMTPYARVLLGLARVLRARLGSGLEAFAFATRLTRITAALAERDPDRMLERVGALACDYAGGTRIGAALRELNERWLLELGGARALVLVLSDGWDRGEPELLGREAARLARGCHRLLWLSPLLGVPGYQPQTRGARELLPHVDAFLPAHDWESLERLAALLARASAALPRARAPRGVPPSARLS